MDFIVSKVAMAMCALIVTAALAGVFTDGALLGKVSGPEQILQEFCELADRAALSGSEAEVVWQAPFMLDGGSVTISIDKGTVLVESRESSAAGRPSQGLHLWRADSRCLNESVVRALDEGAGCFTFESGQSVEIVTKLVTFEGEPRHFVFVYLVY